MILQRLSHFGFLVGCWGAAAAALAVHSPAVAADTAADVAAGTPEALTLERIHADPPLQGRVPVGARFSPGGGMVSWLQGSATDSEVQELWVRALPNGPPRRLVTGSDLAGSTPAMLSEAEKMALERRRIHSGGITSYLWCGESEGRLLVPLGGALYVVEIDAAAVRARPLPLPAMEPAEPARDPQCDRAGAQVAYVRGNDLWVQALDASGGDGAARRLTRTGSDTVSTGLAEFIAAEEFDRFEGFWWSNDGRRLLAFEVDESPIPPTSRMQIRAEGSTMTQQRYPSAGGPNARVVPLVIDVASGAVQRVALPAEAEYLLRAGWFDDGAPWLQWLNRAQTELHLVELPAAPGAATKTLLVERDALWVEAHDDLKELPPAFGARALLWSSERSGRRQLWRLDRGTGALTPLSRQPEAVGHVVCAGSEGVVFTGLAERGRASELLLLPPGGDIRVVDPGPGPRWRDAVGDRGCTHLLVNGSSWARPPQSSVVSVAGTAPPVALAVPGGEPVPLLARIAPEARVIDLVAADGRTPLNAFYLPPLRASANPAGSAVIVVAYGGPGVATVQWRWRGDVPLLAYWQRLGFGVLLFDGRGMAGRDRDFTRAHHRAIGRVDVDDLFAVVRQLPARVPGVDAARIGVIGWSYGGFLAARAMLDDATPLAAAVAGAPVTDLTLYDTAYTERYLGLPEGGRAAPYVQSNLARRAAQLHKPLLVMHGTADDNVLFENSLRLVQALQAEGRLFETAIYPGQAHGLGDRRVRLHADKTATDFLVRRLQP